MDKAKTVFEIGRQHFRILDAETDVPDYTSVSIRGWHIVGERVVGWGKVNFYGWSAAEIRKYNRSKRWHNILKFLRLRRREFHPPCNFVLSDNVVVGETTHYTLSTLGIR